MRNILIVYHYYGEYPPRAAISDHLYAFERYSSDRCFYLNLATRRIPWYIKKIDFDLIVFHTIFLIVRWNGRAAFEKIARKVQVLKELKGVKIALPQDEFINTDVLGDFINDFGIDFVFSVAPELEWPKIYSMVNFQQVKFFKVLTGYLDEITVSKINNLARSEQTRPIDIGYRAWGHPPWLGRYGFLKTQIAECFQEKAPQLGLITDLSAHPKDTFLGDDWYKFLLRCKYTLGVESGAGILDRDGSIRQKTNEYLLDHPKANFEEVEAACFPNLDGSLHLFVISPRHLEACATRTCQVLIEGTYSDALVADQHYLELKRDFNNLDQVLEIIKEDKFREKIVERAYQDVVESGKYTYRSFVKFILEQSLKDAETIPSSTSAPGWSQLIYQWLKFTDKLSWFQVALHWYFILKVKIKLRQILVNIFSERVVVSTLRKIRQRLGD